MRLFLIQFVIGVVFVLAPRTRGTKEYSWARIQDDLQPEDSQGDPKQGA